MVGSVRSPCSGSACIWVESSAGLEAGRVENVAAVGRRKGHVKPWNPGADGGVQVIKLGPSGGVYLGGEFGRVAGATRRDLAKVSKTGVLTSWAPSVGQVGGAACPPRCHPEVLTLAFVAGRGGALHRRALRQDRRGGAKRGRRDLAGAPATGHGVQPEHLRQRQLPLLHHHRDASRLHHHPDLRPRLHLRRLLAGKREPPILQRQRLRPPQRRPPVQPHRTRRRRHPRMHAPRRRPLRRRPLQRRRPRLPTKPHRNLLHPTPRRRLRHSRQQTPRLEPRRQLTPRRLRRHPHPPPRRFRRLLHPLRRPRTTRHRRLPRSHLP